MLHYHKLGSVPPKNHVTHYEDGKLLMEQCVTRAGFDSTYSILYYRIPPTDESKVDNLTIPGYCPAEPVAEQRLHRRHLLTQNMQHEGDFITGRRTLMMNDHLSVGVCKIAQPAGDFFLNGLGDECWFAYEGGGVLESVYGLLPFRHRDYVIIPKGTPYRLHPENDKGTFLFFDSPTYIDIPKQYRNHGGQLTLDAPYSHRDFRIPQQLLAYDAAKHGKGPWPLIVKHGNELSIHRYEHWPWDIAGWDGYTYPVAFNIHDYQPKTSNVHLPPTTHITFAGQGFIICSFVPRKVDYYDKDGIKAIPCPYGHASVDCDEILYYVDGNFTSRKGVDKQSISLHPMGIPHGPHPGMYEKSVGHEATGELAVMMDTFKPLRLTTYAAGIEDESYHYSWVKDS